MHPLIKNWKRVTPIRTVWRDQANAGAGDVGIWVIANSGTDYFWDVRDNDWILVIPMIGRDGCTVAVSNGETHKIINLSLPVVVERRIVFFSI